MTVRRHGRRHRRHVGTEIGVRRHAHHAHAEVVGRFVDGRVRGEGGHDLRLGDVGAVLPRPLARRVGGQEDALGAAVGLGAADGLVAADEAGHHRDDVVLHAA
jgi:hypothetical protein